jgi:hypothetical protein
MGSHDDDGGDVGEAESVLCTSKPSAVLFIRTCDQPSRGARGGGHGGRWGGADIGSPCLWVCNHCDPMMCDGGGGGGVQVPGPARGGVRGRGAASAAAAGRAVARDARGGAHAPAAVGGRGRAHPGHGLGDMMIWPIAPRRRSPPCSPHRTVSPQRLLSTSPGVCCVARMLSRRCGSSFLCTTWRTRTCPRRRWPGATPRRARSRRSAAAWRSSAMMMPTSRARSRGSGRHISCCVGWLPRRHARPAKSATEWLVGEPETSCCCCGPAVSEGARSAAVCCPARPQRHSPAHSPD